MKRHRNPDVDLRQTERRLYSGGGLHDQARMIVENVRRGRLSADRLILAAGTDPAAALVVKEMGLRPSKRFWDRYISASYVDADDFLEEILDPGWNLEFNPFELGEILFTISKKVSARKRMLACILVTSLEPFEKAYTRELRSLDANLLKWSLRVLRRHCSGKRRVTKKEIESLRYALERQDDDLYERGDTTGDWDRGERLERARTIVRILERYFTLVAGRSPYTLTVQEVSEALEILDSMGVYVRPKARVHKRWGALVTAWCLDPEIQ